jgi:hypothetical protein
MTSKGTTQIYFLQTQTLGRPALTEVHLLKVISVGLAERPAPLACRRKRGQMCARDLGEEYDLVQKQNTRVNVVAMGGGTGGARCW